MVIQAGAQLPVWINELHYDNASTDVGEFVELAGQAGTDLSIYTVVLYNGNGGTTYGTITFAGSIDDEQNGFGAVSKLHSGIQNGAPDGLALVRNGTEVLQFLSYEGQFTASNGPAAGMTSVDIGVSESGSTPTGQSLQLIGSGTSYADFNWTGPTDDSPGTLNDGQTMQSLGDILMEDLRTDPAGPGSADTVDIQVDLTPIGGATLLSATAYYRIGTVGVYTPLSMSAAGGVYTTTSSIAAQPEGTTVQYYVEVQFIAGGGANQSKTSPEDGADGPASYTIPRLKPGQIWINEINYTAAIFGDDLQTNEFIEVVGPAGANISGWSMQFVNSLNQVYATQTFATVVLNNDESGYGFMVLGDAGVTNLDAPFTHPGVADGNDHVRDTQGALRLFNEVGALEHALVYGGMSIADHENAGTEDDFFDEDERALTGSGSNATSFVWSQVLKTGFSPGGGNSGQTLTGGNTNNLPPTIICPDNVVDICNGGSLPPADINEVTAIGFCGDGSVTVTHVGDVSNGGGGCAGDPLIVERTYRAVSDCGTTNECTQIFRYEDNMPPEISGYTNTLANAGFEFGDFTGWDFTAPTGATPSGMMAYYPLDTATVSGTTAEDQIPPPQDATLNGGAALVPALINEGIDLVNSGLTATQYIDMGDELDPGSDSYSVSIWIRMDATSGSQFLVSKGNRFSSRSGFSVFTSGDDLFVRGRDSNNTTSWGQSIRDHLIAGSWQNIVLVIDRGDRRVRGYLNGSNDGWLPLGNDLLAAGGQIDVDQPFQIGRAAEDGRLPLNAVVDDVSVWNRALSDTEIVALFENGLAGKGADQGDSVAPEVVVTDPYAGLYHARIAGKPLEGVPENVVNIFQDLPAQPGQVWRAGMQVQIQGDFIGSQSAVLGGEPFDYLLGTLLDGQAGGVGWDPAGDWLVNNTTAALIGTPLFYSDGTYTLDSTGNRLSVRGTGSSGGDTTATRSIDLSRVPDPMLELGKIGADGSTIWVAYLGDVAFSGVGSGTIQRWAGVSLLDGNTEQVTFGRSTDNNFWSIRTDTEALISTEPASILRFMVARIDFKSGNDDVWMWLNPALDQEPDISNAAASGSVSDFQFNGVRIGVGRYQSFDVDELRVGTSFSAVAPSSADITDVLGNQARVELVYMDATSNVLERIISPGSTNLFIQGQYRNLSATGTAPANTAWARIVGAYEQRNDTPSVAYFDETSLAQNILSANPDCVGILPDLTALVTATDNCEVVSITMNPIAGTELQLGDTLVDITAADACGQSTTSTVVMTVLADDTTPPTLDGPAPATYDCGTDPTDDTSYSEYNDGWEDGDDGGDGWAGGWELVGSGSVAGFLVASSTGNGDGDDNGDEDIDAFGTSWGIYAYAGRSAKAYRRLTRPLDPGHRILVDMDTGWIASNGEVGFELRNSMTTQTVFKLSYPGSGSTYQITDAGGMVDTGLPFTDEGLRIKVIVSSTNSYRLHVTPLATASTAIFTGPLDPVAAAGIDELLLFNQNAGTGPARQAFFNRISHGLALPAPDPLEIDAFDSCGAVEVRFSSDVSNGMQPETITRTYIGIDEAGNLGHYAQSMVVDDLRPPVIICPDGIVVPCTVDVPFPNPLLVTTFDNCSPTTTVSWVSDTTNLVENAQHTVLVIDRAYQALDDAGNRSVCTQAITVADNIPPQLSCPPNFTVQTLEDVPLPDTNSVLAIDNCMIVEFEHQDDVDNGGAGTEEDPLVIVRTYRASDPSGNEGTCSHIITVNGTDIYGPAPDVNIVGVEITSNVVIRATGTNAWFLAAEYIQDLKVSPQVWQNASILTNLYHNGTNTTVFEHPQGPSPVHMRIRQYRP